MRSSQLEKVFSSQLAKKKTTSLKFSLTHSIDRGFLNHLGHKAHAIDRPTAAADEQNFSFVASSDRLDTRLLNDDLFEDAFCLMQIRSAPSLSANGYEYLSSLLPQPYRFLSVRCFMEKECSIEIEDNAGEKVKRFLFIYGKIKLNRRSDNVLYIMLCNSIVRYRCTHC